MPFDDNIISQIGYPGVIHAETDRFNVNFLLRILSANYKRGYTFAAIVFSSIRNPLYLAR